ncbi:MAG: hypothetical protein ABIE36_03030 [Candidatus Diapherotrites archaeon]
MEKKSLFIFVFLIISIGFISAIPGIPHQFYGNVGVNGQPSDDILVAKINGKEYSTIINNGFYGVKPNTFFVEDPNGDNLGKTINFFVGGKPAGTYVFENNKLTKLDFSLTTTCGDGYCLGDETCSSCEIDCEICTEPPEIFITSPENKVYDNPKIDLNVYSDQNILIWMYSINSQTPQVFIPNITMTLNDGNYELRITGINTAYQTNSKIISFIVGIPYDYCGDGICNNGETCSICPNDCGVCSTTITETSSGGGGGSSIKKPNVTTNVTTLSINENATIQTDEININQGNTNEQNGDNENKNFFSRITGAVISAGKNINIFKLLLGVIVIIFILIFTFVLIKNKRKRHYISDYH